MDLSVTSQMQPQSLFWSNHPLGTHCWGHMEITKWYLRTLYNINFLLYSLVALSSLSNASSQTQSSNLFTKKKKVLLATWNKLDEVGSLNKTWSITHIKSEIERNYTHYNESV